MKNVLKGALAGMIAAAPMTIVMELLHRSFPRERRRPLPPERITMNVARAVGIREHFADEGARLGATLIAHFGYAAATGAVYALLKQKSAAAPASDLAARDSVAFISPALDGALYGVAVWTVSYLGFVPASGLLTAATKHPAERNATMIVSHVVWGATLGATFDKMADVRQDDARRVKS